MSGTRLAIIECRIVPGYDKPPENGNKQQPMVYVRDRQSLSGTMVNGLIIGSKTRGTSPGYLLGHGDIVRIQPHWEFVIHLPQVAAWSRPLKEIQSLEVQLFRDRYLITDRSLGDGFFGNVYLAFDIKRKRQLACKVIDLARFRNGQHEESFFEKLGREADILSRIKHHTVYIITELATGGDLFSMFQLHDGCFSEDQTRFVIYQVLRGIVYLHKKGLAHRDLKLENIYFANGPDLHTRILLGDFGHSKCTSWGRLTSHVGTEKFQAPYVDFRMILLSVLLTCLSEICRNSDHYTKAVDIWSIGVIAFVLQTPADVPVFPSFTTMDQVSIDNYLTEVFTSSDEIQPISEDAQDFIRRCLRVDARQRITAAEAKRHNWFNLPKSVIDEWTTLRNQSWKPSHHISPPVETLPDFEEVVSYRHLARNNNELASRPRSSQIKRRQPVVQPRIAIGSGKSRYFSPKLNVQKEAKKVKKRESTVGTLKVTQSSRNAPRDIKEL